jgi:hypothetical protein
MNSLNLCCPRWVRCLAAAALGMAAGLAQAGTVCVQSTITTDIARSRAEVHVNGLGFAWKSITVDVSSGFRPMCAEFTDREFDTTRGEMRVQVNYRQAPTGGVLGMRACSVYLPTRTDMTLHVSYDTEGVTVFAVDPRLGPVVLNPKGERMVRCK